MIRVLALAATSAALVSFAARPGGSGYLAWVAVVPLLHALAGERRLWGGALAGWVASLGAGLAAFEGAAPMVAWSYPALVVLSGTGWSVAGAAFVLVRRRWGVTVALLAFPAFVTGVGFLAGSRRVFGDLANGFTHLGYTQFDTPLLAVAGWSGIGGVTLVVLALNVVVALAWIARTPRGALALGLTCAPLFVVPVPGQQTLDAPARELRVAAVQTAVPSLDQVLARLDGDAADRLLEPYVRLSEAAVAGGARLVVWGESVLPYTLRDGRVPEDVGRALAGVPSHAGIRSEALGARRRAGRRPGTLPT